MTKITKKEMFNSLLENYDLTEEEVAFVKHEIELLEKKNSSKSNSLTPTQKENESYKEHILSVMADGTLYTITEIMKLSEELSELSNQRVSALIRQMKESGLVERVEDKRKAYFRKV